MPRVWIGYSNSLGFRDLIIRYIDPYFGTISENNHIGLLERDFGASKIGSGSFEVYEQTSDLKEIFNLDYVLSRFPFRARPPGLNAVDWSKARTVFFVANENWPRVMTDGNASITDILDVKFDWK